MVKYGKEAFDWINKKIREDEETLLRHKRQLGEMLENCDHEWSKDICVICGSIKPLPEEAPYGWCPICSAVGVSRERSPNGCTVCAEGHKYLSIYSIKWKDD